MMNQSNQGHHNEKGQLTQRPNKSPDKLSRTQGELPSLNQEDDLLSELLPKEQDNQPEEPLQLGKEAIDRCKKERNPAIHKLDSHQPDTPTTTGPQCHLIHTATDTECKILI